MWKMDPYRLWHPSCVYITAQRQVHCSTKDAYTSEITFLALLPWFDLRNSIVWIINGSRHWIAKESWEFRSTILLGGDDSFLPVCSVSCTVHLQLLTNIIIYYRLGQNFLIINKFITIISLVLSKCADSWRLAYINTLYTIISLVLTNCAGSWRLLTSSLYTL